MAVARKRVLAPMMPRIPLERSAGTFTEGEVDERPDTTTRIATFQVSTADYAELEQLAKSRERTVSAELRLALAAYLAEQRRVAS